MYRRSAGRGSMPWHQNRVTDASKLLIPRPVRYLSSDVTESQLHDPNVVNLQKSIRVIGGYSEDEDRKFHYNKSYLKFIKPEYLPTLKEHFVKKVSFDLSISQEKGKPYTGTDRRGFLNLLQWILCDMEEKEGDDHLDETKDQDGCGAYGPGRRINADFVCQKNVISRLFFTPYSFNRAWVMFACRYNGTIYMMNETTDVSYKAESDNVQIHHWSHKFEDFMTGEDPQNSAIMNEDYRSVLRSKIGSHKLLYSAAADCADPNLYQDDHSDLSAFIDLKCNTNPDTEEQQGYFAYKLMFFWGGCILTGIPRIIVGFRDDKGMMRNLKLFTSNEIVCMSEGRWEPLKMVTFTNTALSFIKEKVQHGKEGSIFKFERESRSTFISCTENVESPMGPLVPQWFLDEINVETDD